MSTESKWTDEDRRTWVSCTAPVKLNIQGTDVPIFLEPKVFSSGSVGFYFSGKVFMADGLKYQATLSYVVVGSKRSGNSEPTVGPPASQTAEPGIPQKPRKPRGNKKPNQEPANAPDASEANLDAPGQGRMFD